MAGIYRSLLRAATVALLLATSAEASFMANLLSHGEEDAELIELDIKHHTPETPLLNNGAVQLMNLRAMTPGAQPDILQYIEKELHDFFKIQIFAEILIGSNKQPFNLIFDTGSPWVWVGHERCVTCANPAHFQSHKSRTFKQRSQNISTLRYGKGSVKGYDTTDQVCLNRESTDGNGCMQDFRFKSVVHQDDLGGLAGAGLIGLAPSGGAAQLFVPSLFDQKAIKRNMFSMFISKEGSSKIQIGGYNLKKYASGPLRWYPISSGHYWDMKLGKVMLGNYELKTRAATVMADTGTSLNMIPDRDYYDIFNHFIRGRMQCTILPNTLHSCDCTPEQHKAMPDITFRLQGDVYKIPSTQWFERASTGQCIVKFMHAPGRNMWILGLNFFQDYYAVFDYGHKRIGFAESINMGKVAQEPSKSFVEWATGAQKADNRNAVMLNEEVAPLDEVSDRERYVAYATLGCLTLLFSAYVFIVQKNKEAKVSRVESGDSGEIHIESQQIEKTSADSHYAQL